MPAKEEESAMSLTIYPLNLGEVEVDFSFLVWQTNCGNPTYVPATAWLITGADKPMLVDAGFRSADDVKAYSGLNARQSSEQTLEAQLSRHNLKPTDIGYVVHTHLHLDHCGLDDRLPNARILVQRAELQYTAAPLFPVPFYDRLDIAKLVGELWNRVELLDGESELFPGIRTAIITGDAAYIAAINVKQQVPFGYYINLEDVMAGLRRIAKEGKHVLPTHDAEVYKLYPEGIR